MVFILGQVVKPTKDSIKWMPKMAMVATAGKMARDT